MNPNQTHEFVLQIPDGLMPLLALIVVGAVIVKVVQLWRQGWSLERIADEGVVEAVEFVESTPIPTYLEQLWLRNDVPKWVKEAVETSLAIADPRHPMSATEGQKALHRILSNITDGDLDT